MSRLTNGAPTRVFHQGPQLARCTMTGCSLAVRTLVLFDRFGRHTAATPDIFLMVASRRIKARHRLTPREALVV